MVYKVIAISGSLQKTSTNTGLLRACLEIKNPDLEIEILDISEFPHLNTDLIQNGKYPNHVEQARQKVIKADAVFFSVPEYNSKVSAALKNAYDWLSFSMDPANSPAPMKEKVAGMIGAGFNGANQAQEHLVQICQYCKVKLMRKPVIQVKRYEPGNFDEKGNLVSQQARNDLSAYLKEFAQFISKNI
jgi:chromate reductase